MNLDFRIREIVKIEEEMKSIPKTMVDGAIDNEIYFASKYRIAWFLKESYSEEEDSFYYRSYFESQDLIVIGSRLLQDLLGIL